MAPVGGASARARARERERERERETETEKQSFLRFFFVKLFSLFKKKNSSKMRNRNQQPDPSLVDTVRSHSASVAAFFEPALPYATQAAASALAFTAGLVATQVRRVLRREENRQR